LKRKSNGILSAEAFILAERASADKDRIIALRSWMRIDMPDAEQRMMAFIVNVAR